ncbi:hypothetical protein ACJMK2_022961 [Sinanodonta woodiana]|uniref:Uncharacterized protein n=1 Tax=Sinanodonta woodiana TaxID=1069815 RepID=A0ABD3TLL7_SINWO
MAHNDLPDEFIIASDGYGTLQRIDVNNNYNYVSIPFLYWLNAYHVDYDRTDGVIYWVNGNNQIYSGSIFGENGTVLYFNAISQMYGIAVDSISRLLFYTDFGNDIIAAISLKDFLQKTVISSGLINPRAIVTDPISGTIYWVDSGRPAKIEKSNYDGTNRQEVVNTGLTTPYGLDVDINGGVLYWCESDTFKIEKANVDGSNRFLLYQEQVSTSGCSIALYQSYLYFTIWRIRNSIMRIGTDGSGLISVAPSALVYPMGIHVNLNLSIGSNGCSNGSGGCSHFCFPLPGGSNVCACPDVMTLQSDGKTCENDNIPNNFILIIDSSNRSISRMDIDNYKYISIPIQIGSSPYAIDYDPDAAEMIWSDVDHSQINSGSIYGNNQTKWRDVVINGIAVDVTSRLLFYTDSVRNIIAVISLDTDLHRTIISDDLNTPHAIVTDPTNGTIYWSSRNKIEKSNYDGTSRQELINTGFNDHVDLAVDIICKIISFYHRFKRPFT